jgi:hypothetical protein
MALEIGEIIDYADLTAHGRFSDEQHHDPQFWIRR